MGDRGTRMGSFRELRTRQKIIYDEEGDEDFEWVEEEEVPETLDNVGAEEAVLSPHAMSEFEKKHFPQHAKHTGKTARFLTIRNHILTLWHQSRKDALLPREKAIAQVKRTETETGRVVFDFLERFGFINFGALPRPLPPSKGENESIIVIGAGMSGIAAASQLHQLGYRVTILEARNRIGGRIHTDRSFKRPVDLGASIVTGTRGNPVYTVIEQLEMDVHRIAEHCPLHDVQGKPVYPELDSSIEKRFNSCLDRANKAKGPVNAAKSLGEMLEETIAQENLSVEERQLINWHVANLEYACASVLSRVSLNEWDQDDGYEFEGDHLLLPQGYATIPEEIAKRSNLDIRFQKVVRSITYRKNGVKIVTDDRELFTAKHVLVTLPLGVLKNGDVAFDPPVPDWKQTAIDQLGFGLLNKIAIEFPKAFWESKADYFASAKEDPEKRGEFFLFWDMQKCMNTSILVGLIAGSAAFDIEKDGKEEVFKRAMASLEKMIGPIKVQPTRYEVTHWSSDPFARGSYSYIAVGGTGADHDALAKPIGHKIFFAGEATDRYHPATVGGAFVSGLRAAGAIDKAAGIARDLRIKAANGYSPSNGRQAVKTESPSSSTSTASSPSPTRPASRRRVRRSLSDSYSSPTGSLPAENGLACSATTTTTTTTSSRSSSRKPTSRSASTSPEKGKTSQDSSPSKRPKRG